jgi:hypothetical protein
MEDLYKLNIPDITYEVKKLIEEMKKEEYPELLGVHHYPELREIDFLDEESKTKLDEFLSQVSVGNYIFNLHRFLKPKESSEKTLKFLLDKGIVKKRFSILCPECEDDWGVSNLLTLQELNNLEEIIKNNDMYKLEELSYQNKIFLVCMNCGGDVEWEHFNKGLVRTYYILVKERDKSLEDI